MNVPIDRKSSVDPEQRARTIESLDLSVPAELPIANHAAKIVELLRQRSTIVVSGETGSGKSTQLPKLCLAAGLGRGGFIGHTQPRRLAARSIAHRLAEELGSPLGEHVGFKIRFADQTQGKTLVKLMTDGILLAETQSDRDLAAYDAIIIDEAHERSLNIDFLLGYLRRLRERRPRLRTIITSATIDAERFAEHFADDSGPAPIVVVEGRSYPVEIRHRPWEEVGSVDEEGLPQNYDLARHVNGAIDELMAAGSGDILVFLPTERDIREVSHRTAGHFKRQGRTGSVELLPLYARLPQSEQTRIFNPSGNTRRIVFATNVAESSLTVPGIRYVVDSGTARISRYSPRSKVQRLPIEPVSQASARQRAGRCGRVAPGICIRLYSEDDFLSRDAYTTPEIRRTNLASVILQTHVLRLGAVADFPFLDPPRPEAISEGYRTLFEIGAIDDRRRLTPIGRTLGRLPVDPRVGRIILAAEANGVLPEVLVIAAALEIQDPRERPPEKKQAADEAQAIFQDPSSDFLSYLRLWQFYQTQRENLSRNQLQKACRSRFLSPNRMREWSDVYRQLREMTRSLGRGNKAGIGPPRIEIDPQDSAAGIVDEVRYAAIHQSLLSGLLSGVAQATEKNEYLGAGGLKLFLWPGSGVFGAKPKWIVAAELVETSRQYARCVARIQPQWLETVAAHLVRRSYSDPHWSTKAGGAFCYERVSLFGLPVVVRRRVPLAPIDPDTARALMIEQGLVERLMPTRARCVTHNRRLCDAIADLAAKTRRRDLVVDPYAVQRFYHERLPQEVVDRARLERWDRDQPPPDWARQLGGVAQLIEWLDHPPTLPEAGEATPYMRPETLIGQEEAAISPQAFPDSLDLGETRLPLRYRYEPGAADDGVTVTVPQAALPQVSDHRLGWLVPGLFEDKLVALIKALPKRIRRNLVPAADTAREVARELSGAAGEVPFMPAVCRALSARAEMPIRESDFDQEKLPAHLQFHIQVVDDSGQPLASGRSISEIRTQLNLSPAGDADAPGEAGELRDEDLDRDAMVTFDLETLPEEVIRRRGGVRVAQYPALLDRGENVDVRVLADRGAAELATRRGLMRLFAIAERKEIRSQIRWLPDVERSRVLMAHALPPGTFEANLGDLIARRAFVDGEPIVRTAEVFAARRGERGRRIAEATQDIAAWLPQLATAIHTVRSSLESAKGPAFQGLVEDVRGQIDRLLAADFLQRTPWEWLQHYPRYFQAIEYRFDKFRSGAMARDAELTQSVTGLWQQYEALAGAGGAEERSQAAAVEELRWMLEELRVSLFAQPLGTSIKVSPQRIEKQMQKIAQAGHG
ncbi:ATP-dependent RNA helicase HrpA [Candidatus Laterigemmans baculatus]|uniref:ATP-dependent RNA helicase HrpA n=1 Tax=Candidatus Laterigemmans baculatus TaxID=2770505 RepID=UPI0013D9905A|nr:ATP-dependent RNA helicase HrpA [Candidatus Laterigemmans baculatus]